MAVSTPEKPGKALFIIDMMDAYEKLGLINGETASEDLVNKIFKEFCMGK